MNKTQIYYPRTFRRFKADYKNQWLFVLLCAAPCIVLFLFFYSSLSLWLCQAVQWCLKDVFGGDTLSLEYGEYLPIFGGVYYLSVPNKLPGTAFCLANLVATLILLSFCFIRRNRCKPLAIYIAIALLIHLISCIYFLLAADYFPYTATQYSELYIKQQMGIWLSFLAIAGFITGFMNNGTLLSRCVTFFGIMIYSLVFGSVRYLVFLFIVSKASSLYMPSMFFTLGPFFDFLYLVYFYGVFVRHVIVRVNTGERRSVWEWF